MTLYSYDGPVMEFERIVANHWKGRTYAPSEAKARANLAYQYKRENGKVPRTKVTLPGRIVVEGVE